MDRRQRPSACPGLTHASAKVFRSFVHLAYRINLLLFVVLAGWQSTQDAYLAQATIMQWRRTSPGTWANLITSKFLRRVSGAGSATERTGRGVETLHRTLQISGWRSTKGGPTQPAETALLGRVGTTVRIPTSQGFR